MMFGRPVACRASLIDASTASAPLLGNVTSPTRGPISCAHDAEGKIEAIRIAREKNIPFLGLCLGLHMAVIEFSRNVCGLKGANSTEMDPGTPHPVIDILPEQKKSIEKGGTMRLGAYKALLKEGTLTKSLYGTREASERHRHRYEFNNAFREKLEQAGLVMSGISPDGQLVEIVEIRDHPWFLGCQFHPEFKSRPMAPHQLFVSFIRSALDHKNRRTVLRSSNQEVVRE